jgi:hypothetical protein
MQHPGQRVFFAGAQPVGTRALVAGLNRGVLSGQALCRLSAVLIDPAMQVVV